MTRPSAALDVMAIFNEALDQPSPGALGAYLDRACGTDPGIQARVETLLAANDRAGGFMESPDRVATVDVANHTLTDVFVESIYGEAKSQTAPEPARPPK